MKPTNTLLQAIQESEETTKNPADYLREQSEFAEKNLSVTKSIFSHARATEPNNNGNHLPTELFTDQMGNEQIWQQLEIQNESFWNKCMAETCRLLSLNQKKFVLKVRYPGDEHANKEANDEVNGNADENTLEDENGLESDSNDDSIENEIETSSDEKGSDRSDDDQQNDDQTEKLARNPTSSEVDDAFFNLSEMEAFLDSEDKKELDRLNGRSKDKDGSENEDEDIYYFDSISEDSEDENAKSNELMFSDFFTTESGERKLLREARNKRRQKQTKEDLGFEDSEPENDDDDDEDDEDEVEAEAEDMIDSNDGESGSDDNEKSEFDIRQQRLQKRISQLEENALSEKPWQLKGEISSATRPKNSLLEEVLEFDAVSRPAPLITEETTLCLEEIIKRRIKSKVWDDVERKIKPLNDEQEYRKSIVLQQEKSKESLAQIYEREYLDKIHKLTNTDELTKPDEPKEHTELFIKLDALSNFHFKSKPIAAEARIITNIPAIEMEEVAPVAMSDANLLAPEEVRGKIAGDDIGKTERSATDKKRERRKKKQKQKQLHIKNEQRIVEKEKLGIKVTSKEKKQQLLKQVTKSRNVIKGTDNDNKALKSSKSFFTQMQDNASSAIKKKTSKKSQQLTLYTNQVRNVSNYKLQLSVTIKIKMIY